jgi:hypothetical protein
MLRTLQQSIAQTFNIRQRCICFIVTLCLSCGSDTVPFRFFHKLTDITYREIPALCSQNGIYSQHFSLMNKVLHDNTIS